jgi:hypothetical protein
MKLLILIALVFYLRQAAPLMEISVACPDHSFLPGVNIDCIDSFGIETPILRVMARSTINYHINDTVLADTGVDGDHVSHLTVDVLASAADDFSDPTQYVDVQSEVEETYVDRLVGIALDGIPIYTAVGYGGYDIVAGNPTEGIEPIAVDECGGTYGPTPDGTRYHYRTIPACILPIAMPATRSNATAVRIWNATEYTYNYGYENRRKEYVSDVHDLLDGFTGTPGERYTQVIGWATTGQPIYSPYNERGLLHSDLDNCNGKFDKDGNYGYYTKPTFPYILGCYGPGVYNLGDEGIYSAEWAPGAMHHGRKWNACPRGHIPSQDYESDGGCQPCEAGKFSTTSNSRAWHLQQGGVGNDALTPQNKALFHSKNKQGCNNVCPLGHYCPEGSAAPTKCPSGRYGASSGMRDNVCSGVCSAGYYCPRTSVNTEPNVFPCGSANLYCPVESSFPLVVDEGYYTIPEGGEERIRQNQTACEPGFYCDGGVRKHCPAGRYGTGYRISSRNCSAVCPIGSYCPEGSPDPTLCPAGTYGATTGLTDATCTGLCLPGHYCPAGSIYVNQTRCRAGIYGSEYGLINSQCSPNCEVEGPGPNATSSHGNGRFCLVRHCEAGYYCEEASTSPRNTPCGNASVYCPPSSARPVPVDDGFYSIGPDSGPEQLQVASDAAVRTSQVLCERGYYCVYGVRYECPQGYYGEETGMTSGTCSGPCDPGYICDYASPSPSQYVCGNDASVYCPEGSYENITVPAGYYSVGHDITTRQSIQDCEPGYWCSGGVQRICAAGRYSEHGSSTEECDGLCLAGWYCLEGSTNSTEYDCPAGRYGLAGMTNAMCKGSCLAGYYCPQNSVSATEFECGDEYHYCPHGSGDKIAVTSGYFSAGNNATTRVEQVKCMDTDYTGVPPAANSRINLCPGTTKP